MYFPIKYTVGNKKLMHDASKAHSSICNLSSTAVQYDPSLPALPINGTDRCASPTCSSTRCAFQYWQSSQLLCRASQTYLMTHRPRPALVLPAVASANGAIRASVGGTLPVAMVASAPPTGPSRAHLLVFARQALLHLQPLHLQLLLGRFTRSPPRQIPQ